MADDVRIIVSLDEDAWLGSGWSRYLKVHAHPVVDTAEGIRNPDDRHPLHGLVMSGQLDDTAWSNGHGFYGMDVSFASGSRIRLHEAERIVKNLRAVTRRMGQLEARFGGPIDAAGCLAHFADAVKCNTGWPFGRCVRSSSVGLYSDSSYEWMNVDGLRWWLDRQFVTRPIEVVRGVVDFYRTFALAITGWPV